MILPIVKSFLCLNTQHPKKGSTAWTKALFDMRLTHSATVAVLQDLFWNNYHIPRIAAAEQIR